MSPYRQFIDSLSEEDIRKIGQGDVGIGCDDHGYLLVQGGFSPLVEEDEQMVNSTLLLSQESQVLEQIYLQRPLCRSEFDYQAQTLLDKNGIKQFCRHPGNIRSWALMIDKPYLIAVPADDVRSQYGYFYESEQILDNEQTASQVKAWLDSGRAYEDYRTKTHCTY
ncbi:MAG: hypothetical protein OQK25_04940 [Gammaproteobacteria bacterium]|nr:hypothetical protein [Gammaproteobacteria bacterium]